MNDAAVNSVLVMLSGGASEAAILAGAEAVAKTLGLTPADLPAVIAEARKRLTLAAEYNRDEQLGKAIQRLNDLYAKGVAKGEDLKTALAAQRELNRLMGLAMPPAAKPPGDAPPSDEPARPPGSLDELTAAIDEHLEPVLPANDAATYADRIREAGEMIRTLKATAATGNGQQATGTTTAAKKRRTTTTPRTRRQEG